MQTKPSPLAALMLVCLATNAQDPAFDNFERTTGLGPNWTVYFGGSNMNIVGGSDLGITNAPTLFGIVAWSASTFNANQYSEAVISPEKIDSMWAQVFVRRRTSDLARYAFHWSDRDTVTGYGWYDIKYDGVASAQTRIVGSTLSAPPTAGDTLRLEVTTNASGYPELRGYHNGDLVVTGTDSAAVRIMNGQPGLVYRFRVNYPASWPTKVFEEWRGGSLAGPAIGVQLSPKVLLEGPYDAVAGTMSDALRAGNMLPHTGPYPALGFANAGGGGGETTTNAVYAVTGANAIVDWVRIELRSSSDPAVILATKQALLQRDGDVVATDGISALSFPLVAGNYYVAVRHRNHLGCMTATTRALTSTPTTVDFRSSGTTTYGTDARKTNGAVMTLWAGNVLRDSPAPFLLKYTGSNNDRDPVLVAIGGTLPTNTITGYRVEDTTMDGIVKYTGTTNDRDPILVNIGGTLPTNTRAEQIP